MGQASSIADTLGTVFLLPGDIACNALGVGAADNRGLLRMLVNSFAWALIGALVVVFLI